MTPLPRTLWHCLVDFWQTNLPIVSIRSGKRRKHKAPPKKRSYHPVIEALERREVLSVVKFSASSYTIGEAGTSATITVEIDTNPSQNSSIDYSSSNGTATAGSDYTSTSGTLTFTQFGPLSQTFTVSITNDLVIENNETVNLTLSNPTGDLTLGSPSTATLTINDNDLTGVTEYTVPTSNSQPLNITSGPDSNLWFTENNTNKIGKVTTSGTFTEYSLGANHKPYDIIQGPDGKLWFTTNWTEPGIPDIHYGVGNVTTGGTVTEYDLPAQGDARGIASALGADGNLWFTEYALNKIAKVTTSGSVTEYTIPTANSGPEDITLGPDGNLWFTEYDGNKIGKVTTSGTFTEYSIPTASSQPFGITLGPDGNLWFTEFNGNKIGRITTDGTITEFSIPTAASQPKGITKGPDGNVWFVEFAADQVGRITPEGTITEYSIIIGGSGLKPTSIVTGPDNNLWITERDGNKIAKFAWALAADQRLSGPVGLIPQFSGPLGLAGTEAVYGDFSGEPLEALVRGLAPPVTFGTGEVSPYTGNLRLEQPFDVNRGGSVQVGGSLALAYNSATVDVRPIMEVTFPTNSAEGVPTQIEGRLNWNNGGYGSWITFGTSGHSAGDTYLLSFQVGTAVTSTGVYTWQAEVKASFSNNTTLTRSASGRRIVIANGSSSSFGHGWSVAGLDKLTSVTGGVLWVYGSGGGRYFESAGSGSFINPPDDFGVLTQSQVDSTYTYTAKDQVKTYFDSSGYLSKVVDPNSFTRTFTYSSNRISTITEPDGAVGTFSYDGSNKLSKIEAPGSRTVTVTVNASGDLTNLTNPDSGLRTFTYDSAHRLTNDKWGALNGTFAYDSANGTLSTVTLDASTYLSVSPLIEQGLATSPAKNVSDGVGVLKDALNRSTTYVLDATDKESKVITADGGNHKWVPDFARQLTSFTDPLNRVTTYTYSYGSGEGDLAKITYADGTSQEFQYHATFHHLSQIKDQLGNYTTFTYDATTGNLLTAKDPLGKVTTYTYSSGLLQSVIDPLGNRTTFQYDSSQRLEAKIDPLAARTTFSYDSAGNLRTVTNPLAKVTTFSYDGMRRLTTQQDPTGVLETFAYNAVPLPEIPVSLAA
jgi:YD repeat-containing protein